MKKFLTVAGLVAQREPPGGRELGERAGRAGSGRGGRSGGQVSGGHDPPFPAPAGG